MMTQLMMMKDISKERVEFFVHAHPSLYMGPHPPRLENSRGVWVDTEREDFCCRGGWMMFCTNPEE